MNDDSNQVQPIMLQDDPESPAEKVTDDLAQLHSNYHSRLLTANLRTEAVRAGMIDLDGLKLIDLSAVRLGDDDTVIGGRKLMDSLKPNFPTVAFSAT